MPHVWEFQIGCGEAREGSGNKKDEKNTKRHERHERHEKHEKREKLIIQQTFPHFPPPIF